MNTDKISNIVKKSKFHFQGKPVLGMRRFILIEQGEPDKKGLDNFCETITAERVKRVIDGYGEGKKRVEGTGGGFSYYELTDELYVAKDEQTAAWFAKEIVANHKEIAKLKHKIKEYDKEIEQLQRQLIADFNNFDVLDKLRELTYRRRISEVGINSCQHEIDKCSYALKPYIVQRLKDNGGKPLITPHGTISLDGDGFKIDY